MTKEILSEGRVTGMSSYEEYVRQLKSVDADFDVCTEREWLASSLATGSSLILKVPAGSGTAVGKNMYVYQVDLPEGSHVTAGNSIIASFFYGKCKYDARGWATVVEDYGPLISNKQASSPSDTAIDVTTATVPFGNVATELGVDQTPDMSNISFTAVQKQLNEYIKICDGVVLQPGYWKTSGLGTPYKDFTPDLNKKPVIRLTFMDPITNDLAILLTGFTNRSVLRGISKFDFGATHTENKCDGDFLGPEAYPWCAKIQFVSSPASEYLMRSSLRSGSRNVKIEAYKDKPLIKVTSNNLLDTKVYSRRANTATDKTGKDNFGAATTKWKGTTDPSHWYGSTRDANVVSQCSDPSRSESGRETVVTNSVNNPYANDTKLGFSVENKYQSDDRNAIKNGDHGGWYSIEIDPYQLIKDFIDEAFARFDYIDQRLDEIEAEIKNEIKHRKDGDKYLLSQMYQGTGGVDTIVSLLNELLKTIYNPKGTLGLTVSYENVDLNDNYDNGASAGTLKKPTFSWSKDKDGTAIKPDVNDGAIPRAKLNIYSGDQVGANATNFIRSRADNSENDIHSK